MNMRTIRRFQRAAEREDIVSFLYTKNDGTTSRRTVMLQPPIEPHPWFDDEEHVYGIDLDKKAPVSVQVWRFDGMNDVVW